ncbi:MAG: Fe-S cluster assembly protein IscX [Candidatus Competibacteraceae bacterium]
MGKAERAHRTLPLLKQLHRWVHALREFDDTPDSAAEELLEAIKQSWVEERE